MKIFIIIFFIFSLICLYLAYNKTQKTNEINKQIELENEKLLKDKDFIIKEINKLILEKEEKSKDLNEIEKLTNNMNESARQAHLKYQEILDNSYKNSEQEFDLAIQQMQNSYAVTQDKLIKDLSLLKKDIDKISATRAAALEAQLKEQEIKNRKSFYCPQIPENELKDVKILKEIEYKLNNPRILRMLIWTTFYQKPINQVCANVLGSATAEKCGIYKITNQKTDLVYIGQAVDVATRWKNHAKAGLGIDTPQGNKLYKAMLEDGLENFSFELLEECSKTELNEKEKFYINLYQSNQFGYNSKNGNK